MRSGLLLFYDLRRRFRAAIVVRAIPPITIAIAAICAAWMPQMPIATDATVATTGTRY